MYIKTDINQIISSLNVNHYYYYLHLNVNQLFEKANINYLAFE